MTPIDVVHIIEMYLMCGKTIAKTAVITLDFFNTMRANNGMHSPSRRSP